MLAVTGNETLRPLWNFHTERPVGIDPWYGVKIGAGGTMLNSDRPVKVYDTNPPLLRTPAFHVPFNAGPVVGALRVAPQQGRYYYADGTEVVPYDPINDFVTEDNLRSWGDAALSEHAQLNHLRTQERYLKDTYLRHCFLQLGSESLFDQANHVLAGLSGAGPDELEQEIVVSGFAGEHCRFNRPARALTVRGGSRKQNDLPWIIIRIEEVAGIPREEIRLIHLGKELTAPCMETREH